MPNLIGMLILFENFTIKYCRIVVPFILLVSLILNITYVVRSKLRRSTILPAVVHEPQPNQDRSWSTQIAYNKALLTNRAVPLVCLFLAVGYWITTKKKFIGRSL